MIELKDFQQAASAQIAARFGEYATDPAEAGTRANRRMIPFVQMLASITASGKTIILADAVAAIAEEQPVKPVVVWLSKGKVVVEQSLANLQAGGKYHHLIQNCEVRTLAEFDLDDLAETDKSFIYFATVGTFNHRDQATSTLNIYKSDIDTTDQTTWDKLKERLDGKGNRRPLVVVYDEAHNLSDLQTDLLFDLHPAAFLLASASMRIPERVATEIAMLKREKGWDDSDLITQIDAKAVAESELVKPIVQLAGYNTPMEEAVASLHEDYAAAADEARLYGLADAPKAIYVCGTNMVAGNAMQPDDPRRPFAERQAPPILIWRYLTEQLDIDPSDIAVYCSLKTDKDFPLPDSFTLFSGGDKDYQRFMEGGYHHIIFNLSLQEGWDDPFCYFAYIDKSMESKVQVEQIVGRLLRQPGTKLYPAERLNTAHFYVRVDKNHVFESIVDEVQAKLNSEAPGVRVIKSKSGAERPIEYQPLKERHLPEVALNAVAAEKPIAALLKQLHDYRDDTTNTLAGGKRVIVTRRVGEHSDGSAEWEDYEHSCAVLARWIFVRAIKGLFPAALGAAPTDDPRFDATIGLGSRAETEVRALAQSVVDAYVEHTEVEQSPVEGDPVGPVMARPADVRQYKHALHGGYAGLNGFEHEFAQALGDVDCDWCRNPSQSGFRIPLVTLGRTRNFFPDFLIWHGGRVFAVDTKGEHLIADDARRKLFGIDHHGNADPLYVRLVSQGRWNKDVVRQDGAGYTLWGWNSNRGELKVSHADDLKGTLALLFAV